MKKITRRTSYAWLMDARIVTTITTLDRRKKKKNKKKKKKRNTHVCGSDRAALRCQTILCSLVCTDETIQRFVMEQPRRKVRSFGHAIKSALQLALTAIGTISPIDALPQS